MNPRPAVLEFQAPHPIRCSAVSPNSTPSPGSARVVSGDAAKCRGVPPSPLPKCYQNRIGRASMRRVSSRTKSTDGTPDIVLRADSPLRSLVLVGLAQRNDNPDGLVSVLSRRSGVEACGRAELGPTSIGQPSKMAAQHQSTVNISLAGANTVERRGCDGQERYRHRLDSPPILAGNSDDATALALGKS